MSARPDLTQLEEAGIAVGGVAQALRGLSTADPGETIGLALALLADAAEGALATIKAHVEASYANRHTAFGQREAGS